MNQMPNQYGMQYSSNQRMAMMNNSMGMGMMNNMNASKMGPQVYNRFTLTIVWDRENSS